MGGAVTLTGDDREVDGAAETTHGGGMTDVSDEALTGHGLGSSKAVVLINFMSSGMSELVTVAIVTLMMQ